MQNIIHRAVRFWVFPNIRFLVLCGVLFLSACGFRPVYGVHGQSLSGVEDQFSEVYIANIPDREGQYLRNALIDRFYRTSRPSDPIYTLIVQPVREDLVDLDITKSADATRGQLKLNTVMQLQDRRINKTVLKRSLLAITSYNILGSEFATRVTEENARQNALDELARQIEVQLGLYFKRRQ